MQTPEIKSYIKVNELLHRNKIFSNCMNSVEVSYEFDFIHWLEVVANRNCAVGWCSTDTVCVGAANSIMDLLFSDLLNMSSGLIALLKAL